MARHLTVGSIIEKNKIESQETFVILIDAIINDMDGNYVNTIRFCQNSENIVFNGQTYQASNFNLSINIESNTEPTVKLSAQDQTRTLGQYIEAYAGLVGSTCVMTVVNSAALDAPPEIQEEFKIIAASVNEYVVEFELGTESSVNKRFPNYRQFRDRCPWKYKGTRCGYTGALPKCDYTLFGANGCVAHDNVARFGAFPALNENG